MVNGNNKNGSWYNAGDDASQLALMRLNSEERNFHRQTIWLRDIHSASEFADANTGGDTGWYSASYARNGVRAFFLIG